LRYSPRKREPYHTGLSWWCKRKIILPLSGVGDRQVWRGTGTTASRLAFISEHRILNTKHLPCSRNGQINRIGSGVQLTSLYTPSALASSSAILREASRTMSSTILRPSSGLADSGWPMTPTLISGR